MNFHLAQKDVSHDSVSYGFTVCFHVFDQIVDNQSTNVMLMQNSKDSCSYNFTLWEAFQYLLIRKK